MKTVTSISGGKTSAYIAANYPSDALVFSLVRTNDKKLLFKDSGVRKMVSDRIGCEFIGTLEYDTIVYTMLDLEQFLGKRIDWVTGLPFEEVIKNRSGYLPNIATRFCTTELKMRPIFHWWHANYNAPVNMNIGYRFTERNRKATMIKKYNKNGLHEFEATLGKHTKGRHIGRNKWESIEWRKTSFPLIEDKIYKDDIENYWEDKPVRFAALNNCVGCFHRSPYLLNVMSKEQPKTFSWFIDQEKNNKGFFKKNASYQKIKDSNFTKPMNFEIGGCDSGFCGM